jgi:hypothetical protein
METWNVGGDWGQFSFLFLLSDQRFYIVKNTCIYTHYSARVDTVYEFMLLPNTASEHFLHKSRVVRSVDWICIYHWGAGLAVTERMRDIGKRLKIFFSNGK